MELEQFNTVSLAAPKYDKPKHANPMPSKKHLVKRLWLVVFILALLAFCGARQSRRALLRSREHPEGAYGNRRS